jgi:hypothetical protein
MAAVLRLWLETGGASPIFALPFKEIGLIASLEGELADRIARNDAAKHLMKVFQGLASTPEELPTVMMLEGVLKWCDVTPLRVPLVDLGLPWPSGDNN